MRPLHSEQRPSRWSAVTITDSFDVCLDEKAPDLNQVAQRLLSWYRVREQIKSLFASMGIPSLANHLMQMATLSARDKAIAQASIAVRKPKSVKRAFRRQAKTIKRDFPEVWNVCLRVLVSKNSTWY